MGSHGPLSLSFFFICSLRIWLRWVLLRGVPAFTDDGAIAATTFLKPPCCFHIHGSHEALIGSEAGKILRLIKPHTHFRVARKSASF